MSDGQSGLVPGAEATAPLAKSLDILTDRRKFLLGTGLAAGALALGRPVRARAAGRTEITFASAKFFGKETMAQVVDAYNQAQSKVHVTYVELPPPSSSTEVHQALVQQLARRTGTPDVFTQDVVWIAEFAGAGWALALDQYFDASVRSQFFPGTVAACTYKDKLTALPWYVDSGMLYYRTDLLEGIGAKPPETWDDLVATAQAIQKSGKADFGYLWQGKQAEVLVCDLVEVIASNGGSILSADGRSGTLNDEKAVAAVQFLADTINKSKISPSDVLSWDEEPSRQPFTAGRAAFLRNWSYVYGIAQDPSASSVAGKVGVVPLPHFAGGKSAACLGGYQYGVNAATKNREAAIDFLTWMSSPATQLHFALQLGIAPTRPEVFEDAQLGKEQPFMKQLKSVFTGATPRPVTPKYAQVTLAIQSGVSKALVTGNIKAELDAANAKITSIVAA
ncbi:ABC transporter substrate-binding protein [Labrys monachus]|uniref:Multiple sugar transport system substrate-binding protein n=1 Tax=Labrys monachus TaxID=217067 RepID=A0ABU0FBB7_9HYPH|nr:ABC transporter substrate-binding protein [Labrys monachus]MDQ0391913.1 multiple sugar transport system substrate-binding protein [Labrys monachus]